MIPNRWGRLAPLVLTLGCVGQITPPEGANAAPDVPVAPADVGVAQDVNTAPDVAVVNDRTSPGDVPEARDVATMTDASGGGDAMAADVPRPPGMPDPGRVTLHRLNRAEYDNTMRDLLGTTRRAASEFPEDDRGYGFDNIADVLSMSETLLELMQSATETLVEEALRNPTPPSARVQFEAEALMGTVGAASGSAWNLWSNGQIPVRFTPTYAGTYHVTVRAWQTRAGTDDANMNVLVDGAVRRSFTVSNLAASPGEFSLDVTVTSVAPITLAVAFTNDFYVASPLADRNLYVDWIRVEGPTATMAPPNPARERILMCNPAMSSEDACARRIIAAFGRRAWRRPLTDAEVTRLVGLLATARAQGEGFEAGISLALQAMLLSPHFLYRVELDSDPTSSVAHALSDHELASRLSYFLWSSMPDDALFALADAGRLHDPAVLREQVTRMLADPKARALTDNFAGQWLYTRSVSDHDADPVRYPGYTATVRDAMRAETERYFEEFLRTDVGMDQFLTASFTFADDNLARYYGLTVTPGSGVRRISLAGSPRAGLLTQASLLAVNSHPDRTSPVRRGQWVLNQLLCEPPPPPPPDVMGLGMETTPTGSLRQRMERHRADPRCAACHSLMDPLGFAFEHFDAVGSWRTTDSGFAIDTTGTLPGTTVAFDGAASLATLLARDPRYPRCVTRQVFTYALGRGPEPYDDDALEAMAVSWSGAGMRLRDLVQRIVLSDSFTRRRGEPVGGM